MSTIKFKAKKVYANKNQEDKYLMIGLADGDIEYDNYILFQREYDLDDNEIDGIYIECNGDTCFNCCEKFSLNQNEMQIEIQETKIIIDISNIEISDKFSEYIKEIFREFTSK